ncbi:Cohesin loading factor [Hyaloscypha variabilis]
MNSDYANNVFYSQPPQPLQQQVEQPQFISPAQLFQQPPAPSPLSHPSQYTSHGRTTSNSGAYNTNNMAPSISANTQPDTAMLLVALAEEYFQAAHEHAPAAALSMTVADVEAYGGLIATGLGCLDTALKHVKLQPRMEANIRLRYAGVLFEETENSMEAETALGKGIALCERNHYYDLKYAMQFLLAQFMAKKNPKASMKALDGHISDAQTYHHYSWVYVFRFLRASHALESGSPTDHHVAVQNLRAVATLASQQNDNAIYLTASLMEALAFLKMPGPDSLQHVQTALAQARSYQHDESCKIPQLVALIHILDLSCAIMKGNSMEMLTKLKEMQMMMDKALQDSSWGTASDVLAIPINRTPKSSHTVSQDTRMILGIGNDGGDNLLMTFLSKKDAYSIAYLLCGMVLLYKNSIERKGLKYLQAGLDSLEGDARSNRSSSGLLPDLVSKRQWRGEISCYFRIYMASCCAGISDWTETKRHLDALKTNLRQFEISLTGPLGHLALYFDGVYHQGIGDLDTALKIFGDTKFNLSTTKSTTLTPANQLERDLSILAALSTLWMLQAKEPKNLDQNAAMKEALEPICANHANMDIRTAFHLIAATVQTDPPIQLIDIKGRLKVALAYANTTTNVQLLCICLSIMCNRFFRGVVGPQAEKSAKAASVQATRTGNALWMSVTDGMLARCYEVQGKLQDAQATLATAQTHAERALPGL